MVDKITIRNGYGSELYTAEVACRVGPFAIHNPDGYKRRWNVTHEPSNFAACKHVKRKADAIKFAEWLVAQFAQRGIDLARSADKLQSHPQWEEMRQVVVKHRDTITDYYSGQSAGV